MFQTITDDELLDSVYSDPTVIMGEFQEAFKRVEPLLKDPQLVEWNRIELENMVMKLTEAIVRR